MAIRREDRSALLHLGHAHEAGIRQRHRHICVASLQLEHGWKLFLKRKIDFYRASLKKGTQVLGSAGLGPFQNVFRLGQDCLASNQRRSQRSEMTDRPSVMLIAPDKKCDERSGVDKQRLAIYLLATGARAWLSEIGQIRRIRGRVPGPIYGTCQTSGEIEGGRFGMFCVSAIERFTQNLGLRQMTFARDTL